MRFAAAALTLGIPLATRPAGGAVPTGPKPPEGKADAAMKPAHVHLNVRDLDAALDWKAL
jgi:hypothetical protein